MKNRHILAIALTLIAITCGAQPNHPNNIREKLNAFVASKEYNVQKTGSSKDGVNVYQFAQQFVMEEEPADEQVDAFEKLRFTKGVFKNLGFIRQHLDFKFVIPIPPAC